MSNSLPSISSQSVLAVGFFDTCTFSAELKPVIIIDVVVYFNIGGIPDVIPASHVSGKFLYDMPVAVGFELIAVTPQIE